MKLNKLALVTLSALALAILAATIMMRPSAPEMRVSLDLAPRSGDANPASEFINAQRSVEHLRDQITKHPDILKNYIQLAQLFLQEGRVTGNNAEYVPKAKYLLSEVFKRDRDNFEALITQASVEATLHQFGAARGYAERAIAINPHNAFAYGVLCDALLETGNDAAAVAAGDRMAATRPDLRSYARISYLRELHGDIPGAKAAMQCAADASIPGQENRSWVLYNLGMLYFNSGSPDTAAYIFQGVLQERPNYPHALAGLARVRAEEGRSGEAVALYRRAIAGLNEPAFHEALGEAFEAAGDTADAALSYDRAETLYEKERASGEDNAIEMASFLASHNRRLGDALALARDGASRRPSIHGCQTLALALFKNGLYAEAWSASQRALRLGTRDASIFELAGRIASKIGEQRLSVTYLERARAMNAPTHL